MLHSDMYHECITMQYVLCEQMFQRSGSSVSIGSHFTQTRKIYCMIQLGTFTIRGRSHSYKEGGTVDIFFQKLARSSQRSTLQTSVPGWAFSTNCTSSVIVSALERIPCIMMTGRYADISSEELNKERHFKSEQVTQQISQLKTTQPKLHPVSSALIQQCHIHYT